jgi:plasmid stability protein
MVPLQNQYVLEDAMAVSLSIKNVSEETLRGLRARADRNRRSLQKELLAIIEAAAQEDAPLTVDELAEYVKTLGISSDDDSTALIREMRDTRWASGTASGE